MKRLLVIPVLIIPFVLVAILIFNGYSDRYVEPEEEPYPWGEKNIIIDYETENEREAIGAGENLPLISIFNRSRFEAFEDTNDPSDIIKPHGINWFNVIDNISIDAYSQRFDIVNENDSHPISEFGYFVECKTMTNIDITFDNYSLTLNVGEDILEIVPVRWRSYINLGDQEMIVHWGNILINDLDLPSNFSFHLEKCYVIEQFMHYVEQSEPGEGFGGSMNQYLILDQNYEPVLINMGRNLGWMS